MFNKYLKYKNKYFKLKNLYGGAAATPAIRITYKTGAGETTININDSNSAEYIRKINSGELILKEGQRPQKVVKLPFERFERGIRYEIFLPDSVLSSEPPRESVSAAAAQDSLQTFDITKEPSIFARPAYKIDSHFTEVYLNNRAETPINVVFDSGNSVKTLTNINYAKKLGLVVTPIMATTKIISAFNSHIDLSLHLKPEIKSTLKIPIKKISQPKRSMATLQTISEDTLYAIENTEYEPTKISDLISKCQAINSVLPSNKLTKIMASIGIPHGIGLGDAYTFYDKETVIDMIIPTTRNKKLNIKLNCLVETSLSQEKSYILVCNNDIRKMSKLGIILDYPQSAHIKREQIEIKNSELEIIINNIEMIKMMESEIAEASSVKTVSGFGTFGSAVSSGEAEAISSSYTKNSALAIKLTRELEELHKHDIKAEEI